MYIQTFWLCDGWLPHVFANYVASQIWFSQKNSSDPFFKPSPCSLSLFWLKAGARKKTCENICHHQPKMRVLMLATSSAETAAMCTGQLLRSAWTDFEQSCWCQIGPHCVSCGAKLDIQTMNHKSWSQFECYRIRNNGLKGELPQGIRFLMHPYFRVISL